MKYRIIASIVLIIALGVVGYLMFGGSANQSSSDQAIPGLNAPSFHSK